MEVSDVTREGYIYGVVQVRHVFLYLRRASLISHVIDWSMLRGKFSPKYLCSTLDGSLPRNRIETFELVKHLTTRSSEPPYFTTFDWDTFIEKLLESESAVVGSVWSTEKWYCTLCMRDLFRLALRKWWIVEREKGK